MMWTYFNGQFKRTDNIYAAVTDIDSPTRVRVPGGRRRSEVHQIFKRIDFNECSSSTVASDIIYIVAIDDDNDVHMEPL